jgi:hypothetical protein
MSAAAPTPVHEPLELVFGKWINEGEMLATGGAPAVKILASDAYEGLSGGFSVLRTAYGTIGAAGVAGSDIIGHEPEARSLRRI